MWAGTRKRTRGSALSQQLWGTALELFLLPGQGTGARSVVTPSASHLGGVCALGGSHSALLTLRLLPPDPEPASLPGAPREREWGFWGAAGAGTPPPPGLLTPSFQHIPPPPGCLHSSECSEHYQCLHFCHCLCWLHFKGNKVKFCLPTRKLWGFFPPNMPELSQNTIKHGTNHPWKAWACLG